GCSFPGAWSGHGPRRGRASCGTSGPSMTILAGTHPGLKQDACRLPAHALWFRRRLLAWYARHGRRLPWRGMADPYAVLVSEIMLQQTQRSEERRVGKEWR